MSLISSASGSSIPALASFTAASISYGLFDVFEIARLGPALVNNVLAHHLNAIALFAHFLILRALGTKRQGPTWNGQRYRYVLSSTNRGPLPARHHSAAKRSPFSRQKRPFCRSKAPECSVRACKIRCFSRGALLMSPFRTGCSRKRKCKEGPRVQQCWQPENLALVGSTIPVHGYAQPIVLPVLVGQCKPSAQGT